MLTALGADQFVLDGELVIEIDGRLAFDALQMRLHPAESRIRKLSVQTPARLVVFDMLAAPDGPVVIDRPLQQRRCLLEAFMAKAEIAKAFVISPATSDSISGRGLVARCRRRRNGRGGRKGTSPHL